MGTPDKTDWPEGYKLAQTKGTFLMDSRLLFSTINRDKLCRSDS